MEASSLVQKAQRLTDLELAILLCLIADHHCIIDTDEEALERLSDELALVCCFQYLTLARLTTPLRYLLEYLAFHTQSSTAQRPPRWMSSEKLYSWTVYTRETRVTKPPETCMAR